MVLNESSDVMIGHINVTVLLKYLMKRRLLTEDEIWMLKRQQSPRAKALELHQILTRKGVNGFTEFYVSLLESYMMEDGVDGHYTILKTIQKKGIALIVGLHILVQVNSPYCNLYHSSFSLRN